MNIRFQLLLLVIICSCSSKKNVGDGLTLNDFNILKARETEWLDAEFKMDTAKISQMMHDKFIGINAETISTKNEELKGMYQNIAERTKDDHIVDSFVIDDFQVKFYGNTAIVTFICVSKGSIKNIPFKNRRTRIYDVWVKSNGIWKAVASQISRIAD